MPERPCASFIIPTLGRPATLMDTVRCALAQNRPDLEVIVASQDPELPAGLDELAKANGERLRVIRLPRPNANAARNAAIAAARGDILLSVDDDVLFGPDYADRHVARYADARIGFVMSLTLAPNEQPGTAALAAHARLLALAEVPRAGELVPIKWAPTCSASYRKEAVFRAGSFDPYFTGGVADDSDIAVRIVGAGYNGFLDTTISLVHLAAGTGGYASRDPARTVDRRLNDQLMRLYFVAKNRRAIGARDAAALRLSSLRVIVRAARDRHGATGWLRAPALFLRLLRQARRDAARPPAGADPA